MNTYECLQNVFKNIFHLTGLVIELQIKKYMYIMLILDYIISKVGRKTTDENNLKIA